MTWPVALRRARKQASLSQGELAHALGVSRETVHLWETGKVQPQARHRRRIKWFLEAVAGKVAA